MSHLIWLLSGGVVIFFWGISHTFPTRAVVAGFGAISQGNQKLITMEWAAEGLALAFLGVLVLSLAATAWRFYTSRYFGLPPDCRHAPGHGCLDSAYRRQDSDSSDQTVPLGWAKTACAAAIVLGSQGGTI